MWLYSVFEERPSVLSISDLSVFVLLAYGQHVVFCYIDNVTLNILVQSSGAYLQEFLFGAHLGVELLGQEVCEYSNNKVMPNSFPK